MNREQYKQELFRRLEKQRTNDGLFIASDGQYYQASWFRDNMFCNLAYLNNYPEKFLQTVHTHLDILIKFENKYTKFSSMINHYTDENYRFLHAKINPWTLDEIEGLGSRWNHRQFETNGLILLNIAYGIEKGLKVIRNGADEAIIQTFIDYTTTVSFRPNASSWEEENAMRTSSTALVTLGLKKMKKLGFRVSDEAIEQGENLLKDLFPYEHADKHVDLVLLYLPFFGITDRIDSEYIVKVVERDLLGNRQYCCRYLGDVYYRNEHGEAEWVFSRDYLACIYHMLGYDDVANMHLDKILNDFPDGETPELIFANTNIKNDNSFLSWTAAMTIIAIDMMEDNGYSIEEFLK